MKLFITFVGYSILIPFIIVETIVKNICLIVCIILGIMIGLLFPIIKKYNFHWLEQLWEYSIQYKHGFYSGYILKLWDETQYKD